MAEYVHQPYPSVRYHRSGTTTLVHSDEHHDELLASDPGNWAESPDAFDRATAPAIAAPEAEAAPKVKTARKR